jgi:hypothetical protein
MLKESSRPPHLRGPAGREETILSVGKFHRCGAILVVVSHVIDPGAYGITPHQPGIAGLQQFGRLRYILHAWIKPQVVAVWIEDDWHAVVGRLRSRHSGS